jgi:hypothetical protein
MVGEVLVFILSMSVYSFCIVNGNHRLSFAPYC